MKITNFTFNELIKTDTANNLYRFYLVEEART